MRLHVGQATLNVVLPESQRSVFEASYDRVPRQRIVIGYEICGAFWIEQQRRLNLQVAQRPERAFAKCKLASSSKAST